MSTLSIPNTFVTGTTINAAPFNANFTAIQTWSANIDNTNIGAAGLFASQILPTTSGQATFGGTQAYAFANALSVTSPAGIVPLIVQGPAVPSTDLFQVLGPSAVQYLRVTQTGRVDASGGLVLPTATVGLATTAVELINDNAATGGLILNVPTGSTNGWQFQVNGSTVAQITAAGSGSFAALTVSGAFSPGSISTAGNITSTAGNIAATVGRILGSSNGSTQTYLPPVYTVAGAAVANTEHIVTGTTSVSFSASNNSGPVYVTLSGAAAFTSSASYLIIATSQAGTVGNPVMITANPATGTSFTLQGLAVSAFTATYAVQWIAIGT
jgi:hypothetical protein